MVIYLDYNATTPVDKDVKEIICSTLSDFWANPSSSYKLGIEAKQIVEKARLKVAEMIGSTTNDVIFTSGGTESNNMVIHTAIQTFFALNRTRNQMEKPHIITTNIEHDSIKLPLEQLVFDRTADVTFIPVCKITGAVSIDDVLCEVRPTTCLISVMLANNETGVIQPVHLLRSKLKSLIRTKSEKHIQILLHTDAAQAIGKIEVDVKNLDIDFLTIVGHKFYGPRVGALYCRQGVSLQPLFYGGGQERNLRPGTENTAMIAGLGKAAELVVLNLQIYEKHMLEMKNYLEKCLEKVFMQNVIINFKNVQNRLPNTVSIALDFENITSSSILTEAFEICASTGAACHSNKTSSSVLLSSGVSPELAQKTLRLSVGRETTKQEIDTAVECFQKAVKKLLTPA